MGNVCSLNMIVESEAYHAGIAHSTQLEIGPNPSNKRDNW